MGYGIALKKPEAIGYYHSRAQTAAVAGTWIATPGWLAEQIEKLDAEYTTTGMELMKQANACLPANGDRRIQWLQPVSVEGLEGECLKKVRFWNEVWVPLAGRFFDFSQKHTGSYFKLLFTNFWGNVWDTTKEYRRQLIDIRDQADDNQFTFESPRPQPPEAGSWDTVYTIMKWIFGALIGFGAIWAITNLARLLRSPGAS